MFKDITRVKRTEGKRDCLHPLIDASFTAPSSASFAMPINSSRAQRKILKQMKRTGCSYEEACSARYNRVSF